MESVILTLNAGSSSLKFAAFRLASGGGPNLLASGQIEGIGATAKGAVETASGETAELSFERSGARGLPLAVSRDLEGSAPGDRETA